jgi:CRISPR-associated protein Cmr1
MFAGARSKINITIHNTTKLSFKFNMTITFHCTLIQPLFLAGAEKQIPEIRPPSIKGALRWWWRAMNTNLSLPELKAAESALFGSTSNRSPLGIRTSHPVIESLTFESLTANELIQQKRVRNEDTIVKYLLFSQTMGENKWNRAFPTGKAFTVSFYAQDAQVLSKSIAAFWLLAHFGGFGKRARRGGGNFKVTRIDDPGNLVAQTGLAFLGNENQPLEEYLALNYAIVKHLIQKKEEAPAADHYSGLLDATLLVAPIPGGLLKVAEVFQSFRSSIKGKNNLLAKSALGLPLFSDKPGNRDVEKWQVFTDTDKNDRRASPVLLREIHYQEHEYGIVLILNGKILESSVSFGKNKFSTIRDKRNQTVNADILDTLRNHLIELRYRPITL